MTWDDVVALILVRWPAGPGNKPWDPQILAGYVGELEHDKLTPDLAALGLRASTSDFIPAVGKVRALAHEAMGPMTGAQIAEAEELFRLRQEAKRRQLEQ